MLLQFTPDEITSFWIRVQRPSPSACWLWTGNTTPAGYGAVSLSRKRHGIVSKRAHQVAFMLFWGNIPDGLVVCHECDVRACCNPRHLFLATQRENIEDMFTKGRACFQENAPRFPKYQHKGIAVGDRCARTKLTPDQVREIRLRYAVGNIGHRRLAREYGVTRNAIAMLVRRETWKHVA